MDKKPENISPDDFLLIIHEGKNIRETRIDNKLYNRRSLLQGRNINFNRGWNIRSFVNILATRFPENKIYQKALKEIEKLFSEYIVSSCKYITINDAQEYVRYQFSQKGNLVSGCTTSNQIDSHTGKPYLYHEDKYKGDPNIIPYIYNQLQNSNNEKRENMVESIIRGKYPLPNFDQAMIEAFKDMEYTCNTYGDFLSQTLERFRLENILTVS